MSGFWRGDDLIVDDVARICLSDVSDSVFK